MTTKLREKFVARHPQAGARSRSRARVKERQRPGRVGIEARTSEKRQSARFLSFCPPSKSFRVQNYELLDIITIGQYPNPVRGLCNSPPTTHGSTFGRHEIDKGDDVTRARRVSNSPFYALHIVSPFVSYILCSR